MKEIREERKDFMKFNKTESGASKFALFIMGIILGLASSTLFGYMCGNYNATGNYRYYDWLIFIAIFLLILTGELIGIYFGAHEEYYLNKNKNEKVDEKDNLIIEENVSQEEYPLKKKEKVEKKKSKTKIISNKRESKNDNNEGKAINKSNSKKVSHKNEKNN